MAGRARRNMILSVLIDGLGLKIAKGDGSAVVGDITDDSRRVGALGPSGMFIARPGSKANGSKFIEDAIARGARVILAAEPPPASLVAGVTWLVPGDGVNIDNTLVGRLAERFFGNPTKKLRLIGITGTNGKTTITFVIQHLLAKVGIKCGVIGTVVIDDGNTREPADLTTPGCIDISRYLAAMVANGCKAAVMEVSSHALHQGRANALSFDVAVFTNLTGDHLDYHGTMENYAAAKAILFEGLSVNAHAILNTDDVWAPRMAKDCNARIIGCSLNAVPKGAAGATGKPLAQGCAATVLRLDAGVSRVRFTGPWGVSEIDLPLVGAHNVMNVLQAAAAANCLSPIAATIQTSLAQCPAPPGRLEPVRLLDTVARPAVFVDYAHTHDALENVLNAVRPLVKNGGKLSVLFGCGGDRDRTKRPKMAAVACKLADKVVVTSDNPRTEQPNAIITEVLTGVPESMRPNWPATTGTPGDKVRVEPDRAAAIALIVATAGANDVIVLAGKGHEDYQIIGTTKRHFDDREEAAKALTTWGK